MSKKPTKRRGAATDSSGASAGREERPISLIGLRNAAKDYRQIRERYDSNPEDDDGPDNHGAIFDAEHEVGRLIGKILGAQVETPTCLLIKARLLELFAIEGDRRETTQYPEPVNDEAIQLGALMLANSLAANSPHAAEVDTLIKEIQLSIIGHWSGDSP